MQISRHLGEIEAVRGGEREHDVVLGRRRLQLEIELAAEALAQGKPPGAIHAAAVRRVDDELHAAGLVEEALEHERVLGREAPQRGVRRAQIFRYLFSRWLYGADLVLEPAQQLLGGRI